MKTFRSQYFVLAIVGGMVASSGAQAVAVYDENFETGTAPGWTMDGLWHVTSNFPSDGVYALGYTQNETQPSTSPDGNYNTGNTVEDSNWGTAFSPLIQLGTGSSMFVDVVNFNECNASYCDFDILSVGVSLDGSTIDHLLASNNPADNADQNFMTAAQPWQQGDWFTVLSLDLSAYDNQSIHLAFNFDTMDGEANDYAGARVDFIQVSSAIAPTGVPPGDVPEPAALALFGMGLAGLALARRRR